MQEHAPDAATLARRDRHLEPALADRVYARVVEKLTREPVEDFRIDFEDGYGNRPDAEEDGHAQLGGHEVAAGLRDGTLPPFIGIRIKPLSEELKRRSLRTLDLFLTALLERTGGALPPNFVVTLPKITRREQVAALAEAFDAFESARRCPPASLRFELMVETPQSIFDDRRQRRAAAPHREAAAASSPPTSAPTTTPRRCSITAAHQPMRHPVCDFAKHVMQVASPAPASGSRTAPPT